MRLVILMYHSVTKGEPVDPYGVSSKAFCDQISWLLDKDYQFVSLATLMQSRRNGIFAKRKKQVVLTFDDGYRDFYINALPILLRHRLPATVFLVTDMLGQTATWSSNSQEVPLMTEAEVRQVKAQGISLGSHTLTHVDLTVLEHDEELRRQLVISQIALAGFGETFFSFSYPWGKHTDREAAEVKAAGYECAVTIDETINFCRANPYRLSRITMHRDLDLDSLSRMITGPTWPRRISVRVRTLIHQAQGREVPGR